MQVFIVEDEKPAVEKLVSHLNFYDPDIQIAGVAGSVQDAVSWLSDNKNHADLIFMDIQLPDGISFDIFRYVKVTTPVIFTTAYDQYAIDAFKVNSIDYLLKPINYENLYASLEKLKSLKENVLGTKDRLKYEELNDIVSQFKKSYKNRFMIKVGDHIKSITTDKIALFYAEGRNVSIITFKAREYVIDYKLEELPDLLDPSLFFQINRSAIVNINAISDVVVFSSRKLKVKLNIEFDSELFVSRERINEFKFWFNGEESI